MFERFSLLNDHTKAFDYMLSYDKSVTINLSVALNHLVSKSEKHKDSKIENYLKFYIFQIDGFDEFVLTISFLHKDEGLKVGAYVLSLDQNSKQYSEAENDIINHLLLINSKEFIQLKEYDPAIFSDTSLTNIMFGLIIITQKITNFIT